jgi:hypothetical protein
VTSSELSSLIWTSVAASGVIVQVATLRNARTDYRYLYQLGWGDPELGRPARVIAWLHIRAAAVRLIICLAYTAIGAVSFLFPTPPTAPAGGPAIAFRLLVIGVILGSEALFTFNAYLEYRARRYLIVGAEASREAAEKKNRRLTDRQNRRRGDRRASESSQPR